MFFGKLSSGCLFLIGWNSSSLLSDLAPPCLLSYLQGAKRSSLHFISLCFLRNGVDRGLGEAYNNQHERHMPYVWQGSLYVLKDLSL